jgi:hypothetical protein
MNNSDWKQKPLTPILLEETDASYSTVLDLLNAIKNDDILNIAVTGPYGSGKSSVLRTFCKHAGNSEVKYLDISLATLDADEHISPSGGNSSSNVDPNTQSEQKELLNRKIEYSILQQIIYRKPLEKLPFSRLKKIRHFSKDKINWMACYIIGAIVCLGFCFKSRLLQVPLLYRVFSIPERIQDAISIIAVILFLVIAREFIVYFIRNFGGLRLNKVAIGGNEIAMNDESSIFNRHLDEILYFFQCTDYNVVIIEDLDRFNTTDIFLKLRELNYLLNKSEIIGRKIRFIYAVKDDMFKDSSRPKFFDYITTVIPVITTTNSKDKLKSALAELGHKDEISDEDIRDIAFHIDDMRLLYNIANEYHQYTGRLCQNNHKLDARKMLAMMTIKNYYPHDFSELHNRKGRLYEALCSKTKREYASYVVDKCLAEREKQIEEKKKAWEATAIFSQKELRRSYLMEIYSKLPQATDKIIIDGNNYDLDALAQDEDLFGRLIKEPTIHYHYFYYYYSSCYEKKDASPINFSDIEKNVNPDFTYHQRCEQIENGKDVLEKELQDIAQEKLGIESCSIAELIEKYKLYKEQIFTELELPEMEEDFIRRGFIAEDYSDYITYFYPGIMTKADHDLCLEMKLNRKIEYGAPIDNIELLLRELPMMVFKNESVWNYNLLDFIACHKESFCEQYELIIKSLTNMDSAVFLCGYEKSGTSAISYFEDCMKNDSPRMWEKAMSASVENQTTLLSMWFQTCQEKDLIRINEWINHNCLRIALLYNALSTKKQDYLKTQPKYFDININNSELLLAIITNEAYELNKNNIQAIVDVKNAKEDISRLKDSNEMQLAMDNHLITPSWVNVYTYFKECEEKIDSSLQNYIEDNIKTLGEDNSCHQDKYNSLFQKLFESPLFTDTAYKVLCQLHEHSVMITEDILKLTEVKLIDLIKCGLLEYDISSLVPLSKISVRVVVEYIVYYKNSLNEILLSGIMDNSIAEDLLYRGELNQVECQKIIASLHPNNVEMTEKLANKICESMAMDYSVCDDAIFCDAVRGCTNVSNAVFSVARKIAQNKLIRSDIDALIDCLPSPYNELSIINKRPKISRTNYSVFLVQTLMDVDYISSYSEEENSIRVYTKKNV